MNLDKLNQWLTLLANLGVLVGLVFLIVELNQSNRIAVYQAESTRTSQFLSMNTSRIENPEIIVKLMDPDPELNEIEWVQALYTARQQTNTWIDAENAVINGLISDATYQGIFNDIDTVIQEMPGLIPAFEYLFEAYKLDEDTNLETMAYLLNSVNEYKEQNALGDQIP
ncbi:MAG TPA: hypothetical protein VJ984_07100 [Xanthomonadales bacterium]|nr:hypothetical protein [Xanthomonadales bacterium]